VKDVAVQARIVALALACAFTVAATAAPAGAALPDGRGYELVTRVDEAGGESLLSGSPPGFLASDAGGDTVDWDSFGACCGATTGGGSTYQAHRGPSGWQSESITPTPSTQISGFEELQEAKAWSPDLQQTLFSTPASYAPGNERPEGSGADDLYLRQASGALEWISQGPAGTGKGSYGASFDGATPGFGEVAFNSAEALTANATGLAPIGGARYLYVRDRATESTSLIDVDDEGHLISPYGAALGDKVPPTDLLFSFGLQRGTSTHAISEDGSKVFFETRPERLSELPFGVEPHLYMRDLANSTTTPIDDPEASGSARYEGASADGSLVFFTSDEGLGGASTTTELYEFDTTPHQIGAAPPMTAVPLGGGSGVAGVVAIANDGSHVYFVADGVLAANVTDGHSAVAGEPNLYSYDTGTGATTFVATVARPDVSTCDPTCAEGERTRLVEIPDVFRPAYTTGDGSVLVFASGGDLTGEEHSPTTNLEYEAFPEQHFLAVESTAGFQVGREIAIDSGSQEELETIEKIDGPTELTISEYGPALKYGLVDTHPIGTTVHQIDPQVYRYAAASGAVTCLSCTPPGVLATQGATLGEAGGGSYAPEGFAAGMSADGSKVFFQSPDQLVASASEPVSARATEPTNVYEWDEGTVHLIAGTSDGGATFQGTTPSGDDAFFGTEAALVPEASAGYGHIYDARDARPDAAGLRRRTLSRSGRAVAVPADAGVADARRAEPAPAGRRPSARDVRRREGHRRRAHALRAHRPTHAARERDGAERADRDGDREAAWEDRHRRERACDAGARRAHDAHAFAESRSARRTGQSRQPRAASRGQLPADRSELRHAVAAEARKREDGGRKRAAPCVSAPRVVPHPLCARCSSCCWRRPPGCSPPFPAAPLRSSASRRSAARCRPRRPGRMATSRRRSR
jgi:hypothetical protein